MSNLDINSQIALEKLLLENLKENRRNRRWKIFFRMIFLIILVILLISFFVSNVGATSNMSKPHTSVIDIKGAIMPGSTMDADHIVTALNKAFKDPNSKGIILRIDSPGGSPVQASYIYNNIMRLRKVHPHVKVYAVCSDLCASAAYYVASATNDIYANPSSMVGSIGVLLNGFGFVDSMQKLGISRRLLTAGTEKGFMDPFSPMTPKDKAYADTMLKIVHEQFIQAVEAGRGKRLDTKDPLIFSGLIWTGVQAKKLGLIDGFGSTGDVARDVIKAPLIVNYTPRGSVLDKIGKGFGASVANTVLSAFLGKGFQ